MSDVNRVADASNAEGANRGVEVSHAGDANGKVLVASGFGINCQEELAAAWHMTGVAAEIVHLNELFRGTRDLSEFKVFCLPGGFSFGDDLGSGRVLGNRLRWRRCADGERFFAKLIRFIADGGFVLGICNGFQVLVKTGLLPNVGGDFQQEVTLAPNASGHFEDRWVRLIADPVALGAHPWLRGLERLELPVRHGEGNLQVRDDNIAQELSSRGLILWRYADSSFHPTESYPENPNGSAFQAAGLVDVTGRVIGFMPHPEAFTDGTLHPDWAGRARRSGSPLRNPDGLRLFERLTAGIFPTRTPSHKEQHACNP
jgi:phosphoribosylformylglycinamidine synthase